MTHGMISAPQPEAVEVGADLGDTEDIRCCAPTD